MPRISQLPDTSFPSLGHEFPATKDGETVKLTLSQLKSILNLKASEIVASLTTADDTDVQSFLESLRSDKADAIDLLDYYTKTEIDAQMTELMSLSYSLKELGGLVFDLGIPGFTPPDKASPDYRYVLLTAGQTGTGAYNEGILTSESVSGSSPTINATAVISLAGSPFNGQTIRLLNTERRFLRAGSPGTLEDSAFQAHQHTGTTDSNGYHDHEVPSEFWSNQASGGGGNYVNASGSGYYNNNLGGRKVYGSGLHNHYFTTSAVGYAETRSRNIGANLYLRIK